MTSREWRMHLGDMHIKSVHVCAPAAVFVTEGGSQEEEEAGRCFTDREEEEQEWYTPPPSPPPVCSRER